MNRKNKYFEQVKGFKLRQYKSYSSKLIFKNNKTEQKKKKKDDDECNVVCT